jgi:hypothetical protein
MTIAQRFRMTFQPMATLINRTSSLAIYVAYLLMTYHYGGGLLTVKVATALLLAMACIWFPEELGQYTGIMHAHAITSPTPAFLVCAGGWLILIGVPVVVYFIMGNPSAA